MAPAFNLQPGMEPYPGCCLHLPLGRGACGEVWEASDQGQRLALKFMRCKNTAAASREVRSTEAVRKLWHPNLVRVDRVFLQSGYIVIGMELADGSLMDLLDLYGEEQGTAVTPDRACHLLTQAADVIDFLNTRQHAHDGKTVAFQHCDVKPSNLLLIGDTVKLADFGLATVMVSSLEPHGRSGTLAFAAPEVYRGQLSDRTDQYSLAVSYCLRGGRLPFADTPGRFTPTYNRGQPDLTMLSPPERPIIAKSLSVSPIGRWPSCRALMDRLSELLAPSRVKHGPSMTYPDAPPSSWHAPRDDVTLAPFFALAMLSPTRQRSFRSAVLLHVLLVGGVTLAVLRGVVPLPIAGQVLLITGIVEGAALVGWRLTQLPKSQALEFLLVSPVQPKRAFLAEATVGLTRLALITLAGLPLLLVLTLVGRLTFEDVPVLLVMPLSWGAVTGLGLTAWAYESRAVRRWGEVVCLGGILVYLTVGVLAGENLRLWLTWLPAGVQWWVMELYGWFHTYNPFAVLQYWLEPHRSAAVGAERLLGLELAALGGLVLVGLRGAARLRGHFHDRHYRPLTEVTPEQTHGIGERPLAWWAVRRVMEYSGRVNIWLAGGFGLLYAAYTVAGEHWPAWMGRLIFEMVEGVGGIPVLTAGLVLLAAVPACFQYGLWDSSTQDRCRRLELLLLTHLDGSDYWGAASAAAWRRGRGYFAVAVVLWLAALVAGKASSAAVLAAVASGVVLWGLYFVLGFRAFAHGRQANGLGTLLTLGLPFGTFALVRAGWPTLAALTPPGSVYSALTTGPTLTWLPGPIILGAAALLLGWQARRRCDRALRDWYDQNHGRRGLD